GIELLTKLAPSRNLLLGYGGLLGGQKPGASFAGYRLSQADVRAMASFRIFVASAAGLATADQAFGNRASTPGLRVSQFGDELADTGWDFRRSGHVSILRHTMPQEKRIKIKLSTFRPLCDVHPPRKR